MEDFITATFLAICACLIAVIGLDGDFFNDKKPTKRLYISIGAILTLILTVRQANNDDKEKTIKENIYSARNDSLKKLLREVGETSSTTLNNQKDFSNQISFTNESILSTNKKVDSSGKEILKYQSKLIQQLKSYSNTVADANIRFDTYIKDEIGGNSVPFTIINTSNSYSGYGYIEFSVSSREDFFSKRIEISILCVDDLLSRVKLSKSNDNISKKDLVLERKVTLLNNGETISIGKLRTNKRYCVYIGAANGEWFQKIYLDTEKYGSSVLNYLSYKLSTEKSKPVIKQIERYTPLNLTSSNIHDSKQQIAKTLDKSAQWETQFPIWDGNACYINGKKIILSDK